MSTSASTGAPALLELAGVTRAFGGIQAVADLDLVVPSNAIYGLIGPNGAGKTTVINLITGLLRPSRGTILLSGTRIDTWSTHRVAAHGVTRTFQNIRLFRDMTALENVIAGQHHHRVEQTWGRLWFSGAARQEEQAVRDRAQDLLARVGLGGKGHLRAGQLPYGDQRRLEIARALAANPRLILLDEPAAGMPLAETQRLLALIRSLPTDGVTVLLVEHNMHLVMNVCDRLAVLSFGRKIAEGSPDEIRQNQVVIEAYLGPAEDEDDIRVSA